MPFQKGQSGNPGGRPPKPRALAKILETSGKKSIVRPDTGKKISRKNLLAEMIWTAATEGKVTIPGGETLTVKDIGEWMALVKFIHIHIDGPAKAEVDLTTGDQPLVFNIHPAPPRQPDVSEPDSDEE